MKNIVFLCIMVIFGGAVAVQGAATKTKAAAATSTSASNSTAATNTVTTAATNTVATPPTASSVTTSAVATVSSTQPASVQNAGRTDQTLQADAIPGSEVRLELVSVENGTTSSEFKVFHGVDSASGLVFPATTLTFETALRLNQNERIQLLCSTGSYISIYIKDEGAAGGVVEDGYDGPYYLSMWLGYPQVSEDQRVRVRYAVKSGTVGKIGIKIGSKGQCQIAALEDIKIL